MADQKLHNKRVLFVEDYPIIQQLYADPLKQHGLHVDVASNGAEALTKVAKNEYDFILLDLLLPEVNGIEFLERFTNRPAKTNIIVLSDFSQPATVKKAFRLGVSNYWIKADITPSQLIEKLTNYKGKEAAPDGGTNGESMI